MQWRKELSNRIVVGAAIQMHLYTPAVGVEIDRCFRIRSFAGPFQFNVSIVRHYLR